MNHRKEAMKIQENSFGTWYKVCFVPTIYREFEIESARDKKYFVYKTLRLDNINGWGSGTVFFIDEDYRLVVLDWRNIISMIPLDKQPIEIEDTNN